MKYLVALTFLFLSGCMSLTANPNLTPEQITAGAKDKNFSAICTRIILPTGAVGIGIYANVDKGVVPNGQITITPDCAVSMDNGITVVPAPAK